MMHGTRRQVSELLGLTLHRVSELTTSGVLPRPDRQEYDLCRCVQAYIAHLRQGDASLARERQLLIRAKRKGEELKLKVREGELIERFRAEQEAFETGRRVRDVLLTLPDRISGVVSAELDQHKNHQTILHEVMQVLEHLSKWCADQPQADVTNIRIRRTARGNGKAAHP